MPLLSLPLAVTHRPLPWGDTTIFDVVHQPRTYNVYKFE